MPIQTFCVHASQAEQAQLEQVARQGKTPQKVACRARIVLMLSNQEPPSSVADALGISRMTVRLWADRFVGDGVPGLLRDASRPGRRKQITPEQVQAVVEATLTTRPPAATHWSSRPLAKAQGLSDGTIRNLTLSSGDNILQQDLPLDPNGVIYDAMTRKPPTRSTGESCAMRK